MVNVLLEPFLIESELFSCVVEVPNALTSQQSAFLHELSHLVGVVLAVAVQKSQLAL